jgi:hypothetical protein
MQYCSINGITAGRPGLFSTDSRTRLCISYGVPDRVTHNLWTVVWSELQPCHDVAEIMPALVVGQASTGSTAFAWARNGEQPAPEHPPWGKAGCPGPGCRPACCC